MKKIIIILFIINLMILTTITKNSTKKLENKIFAIKENISLLKNKYSLVLLEYNFLTSPDKLMEYQSKYFKKNLIFLKKNQIKKINIINDELIINNSKKNE